jgi:hypothetical protein
MYDILVVGVESSRLYLLITNIPKYLYTGRPWDTGGVETDNWGAPYLKVDKHCNNLV